MDCITVGEPAWCMIHNCWYRDCIKNKESKMTDRAVPRIIKDVNRAEDYQGQTKINVLPVKDQIDLLLNGRGSKYGKYDNMAKLTMALSDVFFAHMQHYGVTEPAKLTDSQRVGLHMIFLKLARIGNGDPNCVDNWVDIAGYAKLIADELEKNEKFNDIK
jgi:hypothetical protein